MLYPQQGGGRQGRSVSSSQDCCGATESQETAFSFPGRISSKTPLSTWDGPGGGHTCARAWGELLQHFNASWSPVVTAGRRERSKEPTGGWKGDGEASACSFASPPALPSLPSPLRISPGQVSGPSPSSLGWNGIENCR